MNGRTLNFERVRQKDGSKKDLGQGAEIWQEDFVAGKWKAERCPWGQVAAAETAALRPNRSQEPLKTPPTWISVTQVVFQKDDDAVGAFELREPACRFVTLTDESIGPVEQ